MNRYYVFPMNYSYANELIASADPTEIRSLERWNGWNTGSYACSAELLKLNNKKFTTEKQTRSIFLSYFMV